MECGNREEARLCGITEAVAIPQLERIDGQTASSFLLLTFLLRKKKSKVNTYNIDTTDFLSDNAENRFQISVTSLKLFP